MTKIITFQAPEDDDHDPRYNRDKEDLKQADERMASISLARDQIIQESVNRRKNEDLVVSDNLITHKRNLSDYSKFWQI